MSKRIQPFTMPKWGIEMEEGVIREWRAAVGDVVRNGQLFVVIETDKISNDVELEFDGLLRRRIGLEGEAYKVGALIAVFADEDVPEDEIDSFVRSFKPADSSFLSESESKVTATAVGAQRSAANLEGLSISPKAAELATRLGVDLSEFAGRATRISLQDVEQAAKAQGLFEDGALVGATNPFEVIKLTAMRRTIARRLSEATRTIPHFYLRATIGMDHVVERRLAFKERGEAVTINDFLISACAKALKKTPEVNIHFTGEEIHQFSNADIAVAIAVEGGLVSPVIRRADVKSVSEIAAEMRILVMRAREGRLKHDDIQGGTFSLSNLGMFGVESFDAVINPPMAAIIAAGTIRNASALELGFSRGMTVTLSCDHRAIDGALGGRFLQSLKKILEDPQSFN